VGQGIEEEEEGEGRVGWKKTEEKEMTVFRLSP
jgi:hypothetical protein